MPIVPVNHFVQAILSSQVLDAKKLQDLQGGALAQISDPRDLAKELIRRKWLTTFQAQELLKGRGAGLTIAGYQVLDKARDTALGRVYKARHVHMNRVVSLLVIAKDQANPKILKQLTRAASQLAHPNIAQAFDVGNDGKVHYVATEFLEGTDLGQLVQSHGPVPVLLASDFIRQAALALKHAHEKGMAHCDINPANLVVTTPSAGAPPQVKLLGFGTGRPEVKAPAGGAGTPLPVLAGNVDFMAPEQARDPQAADPRSDIFGLGCTFFYLLTGRLPYEGATVMDKTLARVMHDAPPVQQYQADVPPLVAAVVARMLARDPGQRFQSAGEVAQVLGQAQPDPVAPVAAPPVAAPLHVDVELVSAAPAAYAPPPAYASPTHDPFANQASSGDESLISVRRSSRRQSGGGIPGWVIAASVALLVVAGLGAAYVLMRGGDKSPPTGNQVAQNDDTQRPTARSDNRPPSVRVLTPPTGGKPASDPDFMPGPPTPMPMPPEMMPGPGADKLPAPDEAALAKAVEAVREVYKDDYAKKQPSDRLALAAKLREKGQETADDPQAKFALLKEAADLTAQGGDLATTLEILDEMIGEYAVKPLDLKAAALETAAPAAATPPAHQGVMSAALAVSDEAVAADDLALADRLLKLAEASGPKAFNLALVGTTQAKRKDLDLLQKETEALKPAKEKLDKNPDDPEANLAFGRFYCLARGDWEKGFPFLLQCSDPKLKAMAEKELSGTMEASEQLALGEGWWELAEKEDAAAKNQMLRRAYTWYQQAAANLTGLDQTKAQARVKEIETSVPGLRGRWDHLDVEEAKALTDFLRIDPPARRVATQKLYKEPIDILVTARTQKNLQVAAFGAVLVFNWDGAVKDLKITRPDSGMTKTAVRLRPQTGTPWHQIRVQITDKALRVYLDNKLLLNERGNFVLAEEQPVRVVSQDSVVDVKSLVVVPIRR